MSAPTGACEYFGATCHLGQEIGWGTNCAEAWASAGGSTAAIFTCQTVCSNFSVPYCGVLCQGAADYWWINCCCTQT